MNKSAQHLFDEIGSALEKKIYQASFQMYVEKGQNVRGSANSNNTSQAGGDRSMASPRSPGNQKQTVTFNEKEKK